MGVGALIGVLVKAHLDAKDKLQNWFEQAYLSDGLDKCIATLLQLHFHFRCVAYKGDPPDKAYEMPMEAFVKVSDLLPAKEFYNVFSYAVREANRLSTGISMVLRGSKSSQEGAEQMLITVDDLLVVLRGAKRELIEYKIKRKGDVYAIHANVKWKVYTAKIQEIGERSKKLSDKRREQAIAKLHDKHDDPRNGALKMLELIRGDSTTFNKLHAIDRKMIELLLKDVSDFVVKIGETDKPFFSIEDLEGKVFQLQRVVEMYESKIGEVKAYETSS